MDEVKIFRSKQCEVSALPFKLNFKYPFRLALSTRDFTQIVILKIKSGFVTGFGEAALPPYLGESADSVTAFLKLPDWNQFVLAPLNEVPGMLDSLTDANNAAKAAVNMALHDLEGKKNRKSIGEIYSTANSDPVYTTFTIGISNQKELLRKLGEATDFKIIKLKLGSADDRALVEAFQKNSPKPFCVDINQGWKSKDEAARMAEFLFSRGALFIEQPLPATHLEETAWLKGRVQVPLFADESVKRYADLTYVSEAFDGVNIKLMKSTGINEAIQMIDFCRKHHLKIILGAMAESSLGNTAAAHIAPLADYVDLDGPLLAQNDPFEGLTYSGGALVMPDGAGIGARPRVHTDNQKLH